jgi:uncharacterized SAM-binding protein YcdF (DUF218 family)
MKGRRLFATKPARGRRLSSQFVSAGALLLALWFGGFFAFVDSLPKPPTKPPPQADGIVALTGGKDRLIAAMALLSAHKGQRLLISGVHQATPREDLKHLLNDPNNQFDCCVDVDRIARNTVGNADETARWARDHGFRSLIVVTAQYHMPRSLLELGRALPNCRLTPYPVIPSDLEAKPWWHPSIARILAAEYTKYLLSGLRIAALSPFQSSASAEGVARTN